MSLEVTLIVGLVSVVAGFVSALLSSSFIGKVLHRGTYSIDNATELLEKSRPEEWNELRIINNEWTPILANLSITNADLVGVNFRDLDLTGAQFINCNLQAADFSRTNVENANFQGSQLDDAMFSSSSLKNVNLSGTSLKRADFSGTKFAGANSNLIENSIGDEKPRADLREFEELISNLFKQQGYEVERTPLTTDGGYDLILKMSNDLIGENIFLVETKKYSGERKVGIGIVRALMGSVLANNAQKGILVSTSGFSTSAKQIAKESNLIQLIDGKKLNEWASKYELLPNNHVNEEASR